MVRVFGIERGMVGRVILQKILVYSGSVLGTLVLAVSIYVLTQDMRRHFPDLDAQLSGQTGQQIAVDGPLRIDLNLGDTVGIRIEDMSIRPSGADAYVASIKSIKARVKVLPLFKRRIIVEVMEIDGGRFLARNGVSLQDAFDELADETSERAEAGWTLAGFRKLQLNRSFLGVMDGDNELFAFPISNFSAEPGDIGLALNLKGQIEGQDVIFEGKSGPWAALLAGHRVYLEGTLQSGSANLTLSGSVGDPSTYGIEFLARGAASDFRDVAVLAGLGDLKQSTSMSVSAHVKATATLLQIADLDLKYGRGDLSGWFKLEKGQSLMFDGELRSKFLDLAAFEGGRLLHPPQELFPDVAVPAAFIGALEGDFRFAAETILLANARLEGGQATMIASNGNLALNPVALKFDDGLFDASVILYVRDEPAFKARADFVNFDLGRLLEEAGMAERSSARINLGAELRGNGTTIAAMMANASGQTNLVMGEGRLGPQITNLFGGRDAAGLTPVAGKKSRRDVVELECLVSRFDIKDGLAESRAFLVKTRDSVTTGKGTVNLASETINLRLAPRPNNPVYLSSAADLRVRGSFVSPEFDVDRKRVSRGIAGSLGRFALAREGREAMLPLLDASVTDNNSCIVSLTGQKQGTNSEHSSVFSVSRTN